MNAKLFIQRLWRENANWDQQLSPELCEIWRSIVKSLEAASSFSCSRQYFDGDIAYPTELHIFVDASERDNGSVAYLCAGDEFSFCLAKSRVAPLRKNSLPKLELMAAVIGSRLMCHIYNSLQKARINIENCVLYYSTIVLSWIVGSANRDRFVRRWVEEIQCLTTNTAWKHCPSHENCADILSRGCDYDELVKNKNWLSGPSKELMRSSVVFTAENRIKSHETHVVTLCKTVVAIGIQKIINADEFPSLYQLLRMTLFGLALGGTATPLVT
ncbi:uncharacterized protein LOC141910534 [Tubulanus polymorphus]|uniref:uncharacterized protein LOC141910534 n=1 Tax=Tubulanus polymorphus TaxID=672921 RepID=UPI003DA2712A